MKLKEMFEAQDILAARFIPIAKFASKQMPNSEVQDWTLRYLDCAIEEIVEMKREYPRRKFWKKGNEVLPHNEANAVEEFTDILHFLFAVARINGWTDEMVHEVYMDKFRKNQARFPVTYVPNTDTITTQG